LVPWLRVPDPLADAAVEALHAHPGERGALLSALRGQDVTLSEPTRAFVDEAARVPLWVDWPRIDRAGTLLFRTGPIGGLVLGAASLVSGYASPAGNKPLVLTGRLEHATSHRLAETGRFVTAVCSPGGLRPVAPGWAITLRVRIMHAEVRRLASCDARWSDDWGCPINQHDMLATSLLFSQVWLDGVRKLGIRLTAEEGGDWLHLWRWCSVVMGVDPELLPTEEHEAQRVTELIRMTQDVPDDDARRLVAALIGAEAPGLAHALCRELLGDDVADHLGVQPRNRWRHLVAAIQRALPPMDEAARAVPALQRRREAVGRAYWDVAIRTGLTGPESFLAPEVLRPVLG
jgi:hypothetical protein